MIKMFKDEKILYRLMTAGLVLGMLFFVGRVLYSVIISVDYPRELLEPSNIALTRSFLQGKPPYVLKSLEYDIPAINYEYPFMSSLIAALIVLVTGCKIVTAHYIISIFAFLATGVIGYLIIKPYSSTSLAPVAGALLFMMCHWRFGFVSAAPDDLGLFFFVLTLYLAVSPKIKNKAIICAILTTVCFYTKQYFIFVVLGIFIYQLFYSRKEAVKLLLYTFVLNVIVAVIITIFWPLYWTYTFFFLYNGTFSGIGFGIASLLEQMKYLAAIFVGMFVVLAIAVGRFIVKRKKEINKPKLLSNIKENDALSLFIIEIPVMFLPLIFFGRNDGAFLSYFLQLWMPSIIVVTLILLERMAEDNHKIWFVFAYGAVVAFTVLFGYLKLPFHVLTNEEKQAWKDTIEKVNEYRKEGDIYYASELAYLCADNGDNTIFCGHDGEVSEVSLETWNQIPVCRKLFPYADDIIQKNIDYKNDLSRKAFNSQYSLITYIDGYCLNFSDAFFEEVLPEFYTKEGEVVLQTGNMPYTVSFVVRNEGIEARSERVNE